MYKSIYYDHYRKRVHLWDDHKGYLNFQYRKYAYAKDPNGRFSSLYGDRLKKVFNWTKDQEGLFESDVNPEMRVLIDTYTNSDEVSSDHVIMPLDIEVEVTEGFPLPAKAENKITSIAIYNPTNKKYYAFLLDPEQMVGDYIEDGVIVETFIDESDLLKRFFVLYMEIKPTIITGWNSGDFDIPYLYNRALQIVGQDVASCLSPINQVFHDSYRNRLVIAGISSLDYLLLYKKFTFTQLESYRLDFVADHELGERKVEYDGTLTELYNNDRLKFVQYNIHDVRLIVKLDEKLNFIEIARGICHIGHVPYEDIFMSSRYLEGAMMVYLKKLEIIAPNKNPKGRDELHIDNKFTGAYVQDPQRGRYDWIFDLDLVSLYPSIIMSLNISPETKIGKVLGWDPEEFLKRKKKTYSIIMDGRVQGKFTTEELKSYLGEGGVSIATNGVMYKTDKTGFIPTLLMKWFDERVEFRKLAKKYAEEGDDEKYQYFDRRQHLQKILLNSVYGILGLSVFRWYDLDNASATTETGRSLIKFTKKIANNYYNLILNPNTIEIELIDGSIKKLTDNHKIMVIRDGIQQTILAKNLKETDDFLN